jgi:hypothetical protein
VLLQNRTLLQQGTKEKKNKSIPFYAPFGLGQMVCIMCHSIIRAVNDDNIGRSFSAMHTVLKIQIVIKYCYFFVTVKVIPPKYYKLVKKAAQRAVNDHTEGRLFPATHVVPKILILIIYFLLIKSKFYIPSTINI